MEVSIRAAEPKDAPNILAMIMELAESVGEADQVSISEADLLRDGWGHEPKFGCCIAETPNGQILGYALFSRTYSTWRGSAGIHIEDLYVRNEARGQGLGGRLVLSVASTIAKGTNPSLLLNVYNWNQARKLYERLDFKEQKGLLTYHVSISSLLELSTRLEV